MCTAILDDISNRLSRKMAIAVFDFPTAGQWIVRVTAVGGVEAVHLPGMSIVQPGADWTRMRIPGAVLTRVDPENSSFGLATRGHRIRDQCPAGHLRNVGK